MGRSVKVFIVEDRPNVLQCIHESIVDGTARVASITDLQFLESMNIEDALANFAYAGADVDCVVLDMGLPMKHKGAEVPFGGLEVLKRIRATRPTLPVVIFTGTAGFDYGSLGAFTTVVEKPNHLLLVENVMGWLNYP